MAIKIEIEAASAAEMHEELKTLLFGAVRPDQVTSDNWSKGYQGRVAEERKAQPLNEDNAPAEILKREPYERTLEDTKAEAKEPTKKRRRTKAEIEAEKAALEEERAEKGVDAPDPEEAPETQDMPKEESKPEAGKQYDIDDVRQLIMVKGSSKKGLVGNILKSYGVKVLPELSEEQLQEVYAKIEEL